MKKWIPLLLLTLVLLVADALWHEALGLHEAFRLMIIYFAAQTAVMFRLDQYAKDDWKVQIALVKMAVRMLAAMIFALVLILSYQDHFALVVQFFGLYLTFMIFEITTSLANLRRN